ncbi:F0F1 ATP synthase subunit A [Nanchangia anserum]|uniref:F0F1 ATP synthase subunit A n=1 Tax=Nanchangia anserum TaxID=2692125 RepID=UPI001D11328C|nr:F0F1 ATP synthase subunit A [Nanchangia anserum]
MLASSGVVAAGFHAPSIDELYPDPYAFIGTPFEMNAVTTNRLVMLVAFVVCALLYVTRAKVVPGRAQTVFESALLFCRESIAEQILGRTMGRKYEKHIMSIFFLVLFMNLAGIIPGLNLAGTALPGMPLLLAVFSWLLFIWAGIREQGGLKFLKSQLFPPNVPWVLYILLTPIEFVSTFIVRPFTLFVRLLANMVSGHFLLTLTLVGTNFFVFSALGAMKGFGLLTLAAALAFTLFEMLVAFLQAYIFAILTAVYINLSVHAH